MYQDVCYTASMTGEATARMYMSILINVTWGVFCVSLDSINALAAYWEHRSSSKVPERFVQKYGKDIELVHDILAAQSYSPGTVDVYTRIIGELLVWKLQNREGDQLIPADLPVFLDYLVTKRRPLAQADTDCRHQDPEGHALRYLAYHAVKTVADGLLGWDVVGSNSAPERPGQVGVLALDDVQALYTAVEEDRELVLLILVNGLRLAPRHMKALRWDQFSPGCSNLVFEHKGVDHSIEIVRGYSRLLEACRREAGTQPFVFPSNRVESPQHVGVRTLQNILRNLHERSAVDERVTLTILRKSDAYVPARSEVKSHVVLNISDGAAAVPHAAASIGGTRATAAQAKPKTETNTAASSAAQPRAEPQDGGMAVRATSLKTAQELSNPCMTPHGTDGTSPAGEPQEPSATRIQAP